ncbi:MAG: hypothetical protein ACE15E_24055 [Acidobacteriota bacterium]
MLAGRIYTISGFLEERPAEGASGLTGAVEEYNPEMDTWRERAPLPRPRLFAIDAVAQADSHMFHSRFVDEYDPETDR